MTRPSARGHINQYQVVRILIFIIKALINPGIGISSCIKVDLYPKHYVTFDQ